MRRFRIRSARAQEYHQGKHRFEHWYRDNSVYFITARCRDRYLAFHSENAKAVFWDRFDHYTHQYGFVPWVTTLLDNHYHTLGYMKAGEQLGPMMQRIHGSVAKLVNDVLPDRHLPFWCERGRRDYFDGCIRDEIQCRRAYRYTLLQSVRAGLHRTWQDYPQTHCSIDLKRGIKRAHELNAFMEGVPYKRYEHRKED
jgi:hypothetical protein